MNTKLMDKLFSEGNEDFKTQVTEKIEDAKTNGSSELVTEDENLQFADTGDGIIVEDQANDNEVTLVKDNEAGDGYDMQKVDIEAETKVQSEQEMSTLNENMDELKQAVNDMNETKDKEMAKAVKEMSQKLFSDAETFEEENEETKLDEIKEECNKYSEMAEEILNGPDVKTEVVEGKDGKHITDSQPEVKVEVTTGISDADKAGLKSFSIIFSGNCAPEYISAVSKSFADAVAAAPDAEPADKPENSKNEELETLVNNANELAEAAKNMKEANDKEMAKSVKEMSQKLFSDADELEVEGEDKLKVEEVKEQCNTYSAEADEILNKIEEKVDEIKKEVNEIKTEEGKQEPEKKDEETKVESDIQKNFSACLETSFNGLSLSPRAEVKQEQKVFSQVQTGDNAYVNPCLDTRI